MTVAPTAAPPVGPVTGRLWDNLPEVYRLADEAQDDPAHGHPLRRYLSVLFDQLTPVDTILNAITPTLPDGSLAVDRWHRYGDGTYSSQRATQPGSALTDPLTAPADWLGWLGYLNGLPTTLLDSLDVDAQRWAIRQPRREHGTAAAIRAAIRAATSADYVRVDNHDRGDPFRLAVTLRTGELAGASWADVHQLLPTWDEWEAAGTWQNVATAVLSSAIDTERPAGYLLTVRYETAPSAGVAPFGIDTDGVLYMDPNSAAVNIDTDGVYYLVPALVPLDTDGQLYMPIGGSPTRLDVDGVYYLNLANPAVGIDTDGVYYAVPGSFPRDTDGVPYATRN